ncbi:hypothetical protein DAPPUDRAFT_254073 [Daphnia pulex]|uniref:Uncharacterized protein n=1 Tax=Daphnia pulex TaxID=6669 RepID=E9H685_DAPPU|nr:hypothetical protein DAPPUDRAFT_254073 [Daphnia pulex]|eukprot:EFX72768.1 hypothetical protein DAPPUDRAFT_254073 [Daphnia pulex]
MFRLEKMRDAVLLWPQQKKKGREADQQGMTSKLLYTLDRHAGTRCGGLIRPHAPRFDPFHSDFHATPLDYNTHDLTLKNRRETAGRPFFTRRGVFIISDHFDSSVDLTIRHTNTGRAGE